MSKPHIKRSPRLFLAASKENVKGGIPGDGVVAVCVLGQAFPRSGVIRSGTAVDVGETCKEVSSEAPAHCQHVVLASHSVSSAVPRLRGERLQAVAWT